MLCSYYHNMSKAVYFNIKFLSIINNNVNVSSHLSTDCVWTLWPSYTFPCLFLILLFIPSSLPRIPFPPSSLLSYCTHPLALSIASSALPSKSQSLTNAFNAFSDSSFFRGVSSSGGDGQDEAKAETIRNLRKSFASLFSD